MKRKSNEKYMTYVLGYTQTPSRKRDSNALNFRFPGNIAYTPEMGGGAFVVASSVFRLYIIPCSYIMNILYPSRRILLGGLH